MDTRVRTVFLPVPLTKTPQPTRNLKHTLELANIVADSGYKLYEDFVNEDGRKQGDCLGAVRQGRIRLGF